MRARAAVIKAGPEVDLDKLNELNELNAGNAHLKGVD